MGIQHFAGRVAQAQNVAELATCILDETGDLANAPSRGLYVFSERGMDIHVRNVPDGTIEEYERVARRFDPVLEGVNASHAPCQISFAGMYAHARDPSLPEAYREFVDLAMSIASDGQYLVAPLVVDGHIAGTINLARASADPFSPGEMMAASAMALHVSSRLAALRALASGVDEAWEDVLTRRGLEVADLAARGLTTREIGGLLGISSNTAKKHLRIIYERLGVATRAELARTLTDTPRTSAARRR